MTRPSFFLAGVGRSGTSSVYNHLREHPEIFMSEHKEPKFFHWDGEPHRYEGPIDDWVYGRSVKTWDEYQALFDDMRDEKVSGEATPSYLYNPKIPDRIQHRCPGAQVFAILRDPADRAFSQYEMMVRYKAEPLGFEQALDEEEKRIKQNWGPSYHYAAQGSYYAQITHWQSVLGREAIHVLFFEDLRRDATGVLQGMFESLGVDPAFRPHTERVHNSTYRPKNALLHHILTQDNPVKALAKAVLPAGLRKQAWWLLRARNKQQAAGLDPAIRRRLVDGYREDTLKLQELVGRDLSAWLTV